MKAVKKLFAIVLAVCVIAAIIPLGTFTVFAATSGTTGDCTWVLDGTELTISGKGKMADYSYVGSDPDNTPPWNGKIDKVTICDGVTSIGSYAFFENALTSITIPDSITTIGNNAFSRSENLENVIMGNGIISIGDRAFDGCTSLKSVTIPDTVKSIGEGVFVHCTSLKSITVDSENNYYCSIDGILFGKDKKTLVCYPAGKTNSSYEIPDSVTSIGDWAFDECTNLESVTILNIVTSIGNYAFSDCASFTSIKIPDSVITIGDYAFRYCDGIESAKIGNAVKNIGEGIFMNCTSLKSITVGNENNYYCSIDGILFGKDKKTLIWYPTGKTEIAYTMPNSVTGIEAWAFGFCTSLKSVTIPNSVTSIGSYAFYGCSSLESVTIGNGVTGIGNYAFSGCTNLESVTIPNGVTTIGNGAFLNCTSLKSITIGNSVKNIGNRAFYYCTGLKDIYYHGTLAQRNKITINSGNDALYEADWFCLDYGDYDSPDNTAIAKYGEDCYILMAEPGYQVVPGTLFADGKKITEVAYIDADANGIDDGNAYVFYTEDPDSAKIEVKVVSAEKAMEQPGVLGATVREKSAEAPAAIKFAVRYSAIKATSSSQGQLATIGDNQAMICTGALIIPTALLGKNALAFGDTKVNPTTLTTVKVGENYAANVVIKNISRITESFADANIVLTMNSVSTSLTEDAEFKIMEATDITVVPYVCGFNGTEYVYYYGEPVSRSYNQVAEAAK